MCTYGCNDTYTLLAILLINLCAESPGMLFPPHKESLNQTGRASEDVVGNACSFTQTQNTIRIRSNFRQLHLLSSFLDLII
jgi:hypothetical protein